MEAETINKIKNIIPHFKYKGEFAEAEEIRAGHINATYRLFFKEDDGKVEKYILQKINTVAFRHPEMIMSNIKNVNEHLTRALESRGVDTYRKLLKFLESDDGTLLYEENGNFWRTYIYVDNATAYNSITDPKLFYESGRGFGEFQKLLFDFPAEKLYETIPDFHNTEKRFYNFVASVDRDKAKRAAGVEKEIDFFFDRRKRMCEIGKLIKNGTLPLRVTHNDTKLNNVLIDDNTGEAVCVIDLDTIMPGTVLYDFGDSIRFGANTAVEDEKDLDKVNLDVDLFKSYTDGFMSQVAGTLKKEEIHHLPLGAWTMTAEVGLRFLTDYLDGDIYFRTEYPDHNLIRARDQMKLLEKIEEHFDELTAYVDRWIS